jgi:hypothetical protein
MKNCTTDFKYSPALFSHNGTELSLDLELLPSGTDGSITTHRVGLTERPKDAALIEGVDSEFVFRSSADDVGIGDQYIPIVIGSWSHETHDIHLTNQTSLPVLLMSPTNNCTVESVGPVTDNGDNNEIRDISSR